MERWRWLPSQFERRYIAVNVPGQSLEYVRDGEVVLSSKVVVGRKSSPTPITRSAIVAVVANPPWNIPGYIAARDLLPHLRQNANYLATKNMVVMDAPPDDPYGRTIDWQKIEPAKFPYAIKSASGPATALGALCSIHPMILMSTCRHAQQETFDLKQREISNGCVRVQQNLR
jgi:murein L,D-transpeptidase YcbB/YkuD